MRILIVRLAALGDLVMASVLMSRIRAEVPGAQVTWAVGRQGAELVRLFDVDHVIEIDEALLKGAPYQRGMALLRAWGRLVRAGRFDRVLVLHGDVRYRVLVAPVRRNSLRMLQRNTPWRTNPIPGRYAGDEHARLLDPDDVSRGPIVRQYDVADVRAKLPVRVGTGPHPVVLVPGGGRNAIREDATRRWPTERYAALARRLMDAGLEVVLVGDRHDDWVRPHFAGLGVTDQVGALSITETLMVMRDAAVVVSHDTGPMHLARLVRVPLVALFGPTMPTTYVVASHQVSALWGGASLACRPCYDQREFAQCGNNICMQELTVDRVFAAAMDMMRTAFGAGIQE